MSIVRIHESSKTIFCVKAYYTKAMQQVLNDIDKAMRSPIKVLKDDATSTVVVIEIDGNKVVIKRANTKGFMHRIRRLFLPTRARKNWYFANKLNSIGINTFTPIALKEERFFYLKGRSYLLCSYIEGIDALHYFAYGALPKPQFTLVANRILAMMQRLAKHWLTHRDLNLSNIILVNDEPWLIDLDAMKAHVFSFFAQRGAKRERARFMENWLEAPNVMPQTVALFEAVFKVKASW